MVTGQLPLAVQGDQLRFGGSGRGGHPPIFSTLPGGGAHLTMRSDIQGTSAGMFPELNALAQSVSFRRWRLGDQLVVRGDHPGVGARAHAGVDRHHHQARVAGAHVQHVADRGCRPRRWAGCARRRWWDRRSAASSGSKNRSAYQPVMPAGPPQPRLRSTAWLMKAMCSGLWGMPGALVLGHLAQDGGDLRQLAGSTSPMRAPRCEPPPAAARVTSAAPAWRERLDLGEEGGVGIDVGVGELAGRRRRCTTAWRRGWCRGAARPRRRAACSAAGGPRPRSGPPRAGRRRCGRRPAAGDSARSAPSHRL